MRALNHTSQPQIARRGATFLHVHPAFEEIRAAARAVLSGRPRVRVWVPRCGAGAEAYSWASVLHDLPISVRVFATDEGVLDQCTGEFANVEVASLMRQLRRDVLVSATEGWSASPALRHHLIRADHALLTQAPFGNVDLISLQSAQLTAAEMPIVLHRLRDCVASGGLLYLGDALTRDAAQAALLDGFSPVAPGLFQRLGTLSMATGIPAPMPMPDDAALLDQLAPPTLLIDAQNTVRRRLGGVGRYLIEPDGVWPRPLDLALPDAIARASLELIERIREGEATATTMADGVRLTARSLAAPPERALGAILLSVNAGDRGAIEALTAQTARLAAGNADLRARLNAALRSAGLPAPSTDKPQS